MNKNRGFTPLAVVLMLSGSLALTGCDDKQAQQGGQQMPAVGVVTVKTEPCRSQPSFRVAPVPTGSQKFVLKLAGLS